jgi:aminoglycoside phosphotransferase (APT) family kinase protein
MTAPGRLLAAGRDADVFAVGPDRVLRRYRDRARSVEAEAEVMRFVRSHGYPVPRVDGAQGPDLLMERVAGPTMLEDVGRRPWTMWRHAETLAGLHRRLHELPAPAGLRRPFGEGGALLHLDLHPANVLLTPDGPVVIDWSSTAAGPAAADPAQTWILLATSEIPGSRVERTVLELGRRVFVHAVVRRFTERDVVAILPRVAEARRADPNVRDRERLAIDRLLARHAAPPS